MRRRRSRVWAMEALENRRLLATYYVDAINGDDSNAGTAPQEAWSSLNRVSNVSLSPGDQVQLRRGSVWEEAFLANDAGTSYQPISFAAYGDGADPILRRLTVEADHLHFENLVVDRNRVSGDAIRVRDAHDVVLRDMVVRNGLSDGIDVTNADGLVIDGLLIHHFLAGSFANQADAHGIVASETVGLTIRNTEVHHVSGDSFQADPARDSKVTTNILIESSHFWTGPLAENFNTSWLAGQRPGENAIDTKVAKTDWDSFDRMKLTVRDVVAHGWAADEFISNKAVFNMKEKVEATFDRVTVFDSEIAFRLRGSRGNANVTIQNTVIHDVDKAIRAEDDLANLNVSHSTFGQDVGTFIQFAGGSGGRGSWTFRNNAFVGSKPADAADPSNQMAQASDFVDITADDYRLVATSGLVDAATPNAGVTHDRDGNARPQGPASDVGAFEKLVASAPKVEHVELNGGDSQRSSVDGITISFDTLVDIDRNTAEPFHLVNTSTGETIETSFVVSEVDQKTQVALSFTAGDSVNDAGSLEDGNYELKIVSEHVTASGLTLDGDGDGTSGGDFVFGDEPTDTFYRKFGDVDGSGHVNLADFAAFRGAFGTADGESGYREELDGNGDGAVNLMDFAMFRANFGS